MRRAGLPAKSPFQFNEGGNPVFLALTGSVLAFFAMSGFENAANVAEEVRFRRPTLLD